MRLYLIVAGMFVALAAFASPYLSSLSGAGGSEGFPKPGTYAVVTERSGHHESGKVQIDASTRSAFLGLVAREDGTRCRDRQVTVGGGAFSISMTCNAYDGDIHNIVIERHGTYSEKSIDLVSTIKLWGMPITETSSYRLQDAS